MRTFLEFRATLDGVGSILQKNECTIYGDDGPEASAVVRLQEVVEGKAELADSSPHPWGRSLDRKALAERLRFIPTPVGQISPGPAMTAHPSVHPHARGADAAGLE